MTITMLSTPCLHLMDMKIKRLWSLNHRKHDHTCMGNYENSIVSAFTAAKNDEPHGEYKVIFISKEKKAALTRLLPCHQNISPDGTPGDLPGQLHIFKDRHCYRRI